MGGGASLNLRGGGGVICRGKIIYFTRRGGAAHGKISNDHDDIHPVMPRGVEPMLFLCRPIVFGVGPTLKQHWFIVKCFLSNFPHPGRPVPLALSIRLGPKTQRYQVRIPVGSNVCHRGWAYTVPQIVQRPGVRTAINGIVPH